MPPTLLSFKIISDDWAQPAVPRDRARSTYVVVLLFNIEIADLPILLVAVVIWTVIFNYF